MTRRCQIIQNGGCPSRTADKIRKSPTGCVIPEYQIGISPHLRVRNKMESKAESAHFYSRAFRFATHYPVRFLLYPRLSSFVPLGVGFSCPVPRLREGVPKVKAPKRRRGRIKRPASEEMARLAAHQGWESCCRDGAFGLLPRPLGVGFQRRGPRPPAFVSLGVQGEVETPWCFSSGVWGGFFSRKECAHVPVVGTTPCGNRKLCESARHRRALSCYPKS